MNLDRLGYELPPDMVSACLRPELRIPAGDLTRSWHDSYRREYEEFGDLMTTHQSLRISQRNRRRCASFYHALRLLTTQVQTFGDNRVLEAYLSLPTAYLVGQRAHVLAAMHRFPALGQVPTSRTRFIPLKYEPAVSRLWAMWKGFRRLREWKRKMAAAQKSAPTTISIRSRHFMQAILNSCLYDTEYLRQTVEPQLALGQAKQVHELAATAIHAECGVNRQFLIQPLLVRLPEGG